MDITLTFGKYSGKKLSEAPLSYVRWLSEQPTICGKTYVPREAKEFLAGYPAQLPNEGHGKFCMHCRQSIVGEAIPVESHMESNGRSYEHRTRYLHPDCAAQLAEEE